MNTELTKPAADAAKSFLQQLRQATGPAHQQLEDSPLSKRLLTDDVTLADYTAYLQQMQPVIAFADEALLPLLQPMLPDVTERKKAHWITEDLSALNTQAATADFSPSIQHSLAYLLGFFYVVEGSTLGGRVLLKHLQKLLHISPEKGGRFFAGYGEDTSEKWKSFLAAFSNYVLAHGKEQEAIEGAIDGFRLIHQHFNA